jgi:WD40 repeat protein
MHLIAALLLFASPDPAPQPQPPAKTWHVLLADLKGAYWVDIATGKCEHDPKLARKPHKPAVLPGASQLVEPESPIRRYRDTFVTTANGVTVRMLKNKLRVETKDDKRWLTKVGVGHHPVLRPDGKQFVWFKWSEDTWSGKERKADLVVYDIATGTERVIVKDAHLYEVSWSPDGKTLAVGFDGNLDLYDAATGKRIHRWVLRDIHADLYAHGADGLLWSPDGKRIATRFAFLGGRAASGDGEFEDVFGDNELYVIDVESRKVRMLKMPEHTCEGPIRGEMRAATATKK